MAEVRTIHTQLGGVEDLTFGEGTFEQTRNGTLVTLKKINAETIPYSGESQTAVSIKTELDSKAKVGGSATAAFKVKSGVSLDDAVNRAQLNGKAPLNGSPTEVFHVKAGTTVSSAATLGQLDSKALVNGSAARAFKVKDGQYADEAVNKRQLDAVALGAGSGLVKTLQIVHRVIATRSSRTISTSGTTLTEFNTTITPKSATSVFKIELRLMGEVQEDTVINIVESATEGPGNYKRVNVSREATTDAINLIGIGRMVGDSENDDSTLDVCTITTMFTGSHDTDEFGFRVEVQQESAGRVFALNRCLSTSTARDVEHGVSEFTITELQL